MAKLKDVINFIIMYSEKSQDPLTNMRLNKFLYFAQGHSFKRLGRPLFDEDFKAWDYGPVIPEVYHQYKDLGKEAISEVKDYDPNSLTSDEIDYLLDVLCEYDNYSTGALVSKSHIDNGPWAEAHVERQSVLISKKSIMKHFENEDLRYYVEDTINRIPEEGHHDNDGHLILKKGFGE